MFNNSQALNKTKGGFPTSYFFSSGNVIKLRNQGYDDEVRFFFL